METKPFYQRTFYIVFAYLFLNPIGIILVWKYTTWPKWLKILLLISAFGWLIPIIFILLLLGLLKIPGIAQDVQNELVGGPPVEAKIYEVKEIDSEWRNCRNRHFNVEFRCPNQWFYFEDGGPEPYERSLLFNDQEPVTLDDLKWLISFGTNDWREGPAAKTFPETYNAEKAARDFAEGSMRKELGLEGRKKISVNGIEGFLGYKPPDQNKEKGETDVLFLKGPLTFHFELDPSLVRRELSASETTEAYQVFQEMVLSFRVDDGMMGDTTADIDADGLSNDREIIWGTNVFNPDTDRDAWSDGQEVTNHYDPLKTTPGDKLSPEEFERRNQSQ